MFRGERGKSFKETITTILSKGLNTATVTSLLTQETLKLYSTAFTSKTANSRHNYEMYEQLGDVTIGKFIINYMYRRFPQLQTPSGVDVIAKLKIKYGAKEQLQLISQSLNFWPLITASNEEREKDKKKLLEDVFEAFVGCTEYVIDDYISAGNRLNNYGGIGYNVLYLILKSIFDDMDISLEYNILVDPITRLNELITKIEKEGKGKITYKVVSDIKAHTTTITWFRPNHGAVVLAKEVAILKKDSRLKAAQAALNILDIKYHEVHNIPPNWNNFVL